MVYDAVDGYVVSVAPNVSGGMRNATYGPSDLTWKFSGGNWSVLNTTGALPELLYPGLAYDGADSYVVLFGGLQIAGSQGQVTLMAYSNATWSYSGGTWTNRTSTTTAQPYADSVVDITYDAADGYVFLFDESVTGPATMAPTDWAYVAGVWTNISGPLGSAAPPDSGVMVYDAADQYVVYFGGLATGPGLENWTTLNETWEFHAGAWSNITANVTGAPGGRVFAGIAYDAYLGKVVVFGGTVWNGPGNYSWANDTWAYSAGAWTNLNLTTPGTTWFTVDLAYDPGSHSLLLAGETNNSTNPAAVSSVWVLVNGSWIPAAPLLFLAAPGADAGTPFQLTVATGPHSGPLSYWYSGLPVGCPSRNSPMLRCTTDTPGRYEVQVAVNDSAGDSTSLATSVLVNPAPEILSFGASLPVAEVGFAVDLSAVSSGGTGGLAYAYLGLPAGCTTANSATLACTPTSSGTTLVSVRATDALGVTSSSSVTLTVAARPAVTTFEVVPSVVDVGQPVLFAALTSAGIGPDAYAFSGLPSGCATVSQLSFSCSPGGAGSFLVSFVATDSFGAIASGGTILQVNEVPSIASFAASSSSVTVGTSVGFTVALAGGTAPFAFVYSGLPAGCASTDTASLHCVATAPGNSTVTTTVTDATGASVSQTVNIVVLSAPTSHPYLPKSTAPTGSGSTGSMFAWGLLVGCLGLVAAVLWTRRQLRNRAEGEGIVTRLRQENRLPPPASGEPGATTNADAAGPRNE
jgi:hypothetical protein